MGTERNRLIFTWFNSCILDKQLISVLMEEARIIEQEYEYEVSGGLDSQENHHFLHYNGHIKSQN